jgi:hypothetical protein
LAAIGRGTPEQIIATAMVLFLIFLPFFGFRALGDAMGIKTLFRLFFVERRVFERLETRAEIFVSGFNISLRVFFYSIDRNVRLALPDYKLHQRPSTRF